VVGVSVDTTESHKRFAAGCGLSFSLLADESDEFSRRPDILTSDTRYPELGDSARRVTFIVKGDGNRDGRSRGCGPAAPVVTWRRFSKPHAPSSVYSQQHQSVERYMTKLSQRVLLNPGPVNISNSVRAALGEAPDMCHREGEFVDLLAEVKSALLEIAGLAQEEFDVVVLASSGTGAMEAGLHTFVNKALVLDQGVYGARMILMLERLGRQVSRTTGESLPQDLERAAAGDLPAEWFCFVHHETTLGEMNPWSLVENVRAVLPGPKILVDAISSFGATDVEWGQADVILGVANKCLHAVAGTSFVIFRKALLSDELPEKTSVYLDLEQYLDGAVPFTLPPQVLIAFRQALREAHDVRGREGRYRHLNDLIWSEARALGLEPVIGQETSGYLLASFYLPEGVAYADLYEEMHDRGFVIYAGQGALKDRIFRIANMGDLLDEALVKEFFAGVGEVARARRAS